MVLEIQPFIKKHPQHFGQIISLDDLQRRQNNLLPKKQLQTKLLRLNPIHQPQPNPNQRHLLILHHSIIIIQKMVTQRLRRLILKFGAYS